MASNKDIMPLDTHWWRTDLGITRLSPAARGFWLDAMMAIWMAGDSNGAFTATRREWGILTRTADKAGDYIQEVADAGVASVSDDEDGCTTITFRRFAKKFRDPAQSKLRAWISYRWEEIASLLRQRDGDECRHCGGTGRLTIDHVKPVSKGGTNALANLQLLCKSCNSRKGARYVG